MRSPFFCGECGTPLYIGKVHVWKDNGVIAHAVKPYDHVIFLESENIDRIFQIIDEMLGFSVQNIVKECTRRGNRMFMETNIPKPVRRAFSRLPRFSSQIIGLTGRMLGYGCTDYVGYRLKGDDADCLVQVVHHPYSLTSIMADALGVTESFTGNDGEAESLPLGEDSYLIVIRLGCHPSGLEERLHLYQPVLKDTGFRFKRCSRCGLPQELSNNYSWDLKKGFILNRRTSRRMVLTGFNNYEAVFQELEKEIGEEIPQMIIDAQRRFVRESQWEENWLESEEVLRRNLMLRGLGFPSFLQWNNGTASLSILNCLIPKQVVGILQGFHELKTGKEKSDCSWDLSEEGDLNITLS